MPRQVGYVRAIGHQPAFVDELSEIKNRWNSRAQRQGGNFIPVHGREWVANDIQRVRTALEGLEGRRDILGAPDFQYRRLKAKRRGRRLYLIHQPLETGIDDIDYNRQAAETWDNLAQQIEALADETRDH